MYGSGAGGFKNLQVLLTANNANLKAVLRASAGEVTAFSKSVEASNKQLVTKANLLKTAVAGGATAAAIGLAYAATQAAQFDKEMRNVNSLLGLSEQGFATLEGKVIGLSKQLPQSANTLAQGLYDIASSGFEGSDALEVLQQSALGASAGLTTTETSARAVTAVLNAYGLQARDAGDVTDTLFQTVNAGVVTFDELAGSLGNVVGGAAAANVQIDEVGSAIAAMTLAGIGGAESVTSLNNLITKLIQPSKALSQLYHDLGYESGAAALEQDGLRGVMEKIREATGGNVAELMRLFPEIRAARGAFALMAADGKNYARTASLIEDENARAGATQRVFNEQMKAASNQWQLLKNRIDAGAISLGTKALPLLTGGMEAAVGFAEGVGHAAAQVADLFGPDMESLGRILVDLWDVFEGLTDAAWLVVEPFVKIALVGTAETLGAILAVVEPLADFLAENEAVAVALAIALGVHLAGGAARAATELGYLAALGLAKALSGMEALQAGAIATAGTIKAVVASLGPLAAVGLTVGMLVEGWNAYHGAAKEVEKANDDLGKSFKAFDLSSAAKQVDELRKLKEEMDALFAQNQSDNLAQGMLHFKDNMRLIGLQTEDTSKKFYDASNDLNELRNAALDIDAVLSGMSFDEYVKLSHDKSGLNGLQAQADVVAKLDEVWARFGPTLEAAGLDLAALKEMTGSGWDTEQMNAIREALKGVDYNSANAADSERDLIDAMGGVESSMGDVTQAADDLSKALDELMGASMGVDAAGIEWRAGLDDLTQKLKDNKGAIQGHSAAAGENRLAIQDSIKDLSDLLTAQAKNGASSKKMTETLLSGRQALIDHAVAAGADADEVKALLRQYNLTPKLVETLIKQYGGEDVKKMLRDIQKDADETGAKKPKVEVSAPGVKGVIDQLDEAKAAARELDGTRAVVTTVFETVRKMAGLSQADGGYWPDGVAASFAGGGFLPSRATIGRGGPLVQWAEPSTGGEAFIPLAASKRSGSEAILRQVADRFGYDLVGKGQSHAARGGHDGGGHGGGGWPKGFSPIAGDAFGTVSAWDQAQKGPIGPKGILRALEASQRATEAWAKDMARISSRAGADVSGALQAMGADGEKWVSRMADASVKDMEEMADRIRRIEFTKFAGGVAEDVKAQKAFQANLLALVKMGRGDLAAQLADMGYQAAGSVAAAAVGMSGKELKKLARQLKLQDELSDPAMMDALKLAGLLQGSGTPLGMVGLASASGMALGDVVGLLERFNGRVFSKLPKKAMRQIRADQALVDAGQQPSGLERGGIVLGSQASRGMYYRWAEPGSGGESLIPLGADRRSRALDLWEATGRIIGARAWSGSGGTMAIVHPGAVTVKIDASGTALTARDLERVARAASDRAMDKLTGILMAGAR